MHLITVLHVHFQYVAYNLKWLAQSVFYYYFCCFCFPSPLQVYKSVILCEKNGGVQAQIRSHGSFSKVSSEIKQLDQVSMWMMYSQSLQHPGFRSAGNRSFIRDASSQPCILQRSPFLSLVECFEAKTCWIPMQDKVNREKEQTVSLNQSVFTCLCVYGLCFGESQLGVAETCLLHCWAYIEPTTQVFAPRFMLLFWEFGFRGNHLANTGFHNHRSF